MTSTAKATSPGNTTNGFPAEASLHYAEVPAAKMEELREQTRRLLASEDWDLVDGIDFPYPKSA
jgi:hypothetical protein